MFGWMNNPTNDVILHYTLDLKGLSGSKGSLNLLLTSMNQLDGEPDRESRLRGAPYAGPAD
jgi:hypothetical protein